MKNMGNVKSNAIFNPNEIRHPPPPSLMDAERDSDLEQYIRCTRVFGSPNKCMTNLHFSKVRI